MFRNNFFTTCNYFKKIKWINNKIIIIISFFVSKTFKIEIIKYCDVKVFVLYIFIKIYYSTAVYILYRCHLYLGCSATRRTTKIKISRKKELHILKRKKHPQMKKQHLKKL